MISKLEKPIRWLARLSALIGGVALLAVMIMTAISVAGMSINKFGRFLKKSHDTVIQPMLDIGPIPGETEMVEAGIAFIIFAFMPIVTLNRGHASVEILTNFFGARLNRLIDLVADILMFAIASFLIYRHFIGTIDKFGNGETSWILQFPIWWGYAGGMFGGVIFVLVAAFCVLRSFDALIHGKRVDVLGVVH